jgi:hypothetical protein
VRAARSAELRVALAVLAALAVACGRSDPPRLKVTAMPGGAQQGAVDVRFQLRNVGGRELVFDGLAPACGCAAVSRLPETLASGASTMLDVRCRVGREAIRELHLSSSDPGSPDTVLRVTLPGNGASVDPAALYFGYVPVGESVVRDVTVPAAATLEGLAPPDRPELAIEALAPRADGTRGARVRFTPRVPGVVRAAIDLGSAAGVLPVVGVGYDGVVAYPAEVALPPAAGSTVLPAVTLIATGSQPLAIAHVDYPPGLAGELRAVVPGRQFRLLLRGGVDAAGPAAIRLHGAAGGEPILTIPVVGLASGAAAS